jgi:hypothetical protein
MDLDGLLADPPLVHVGGRHTWKLDPSVLQYLEPRIGDRSRTLETGSGVSTVLFAIKQTHHTCIVPSSEEVQRIEEYCRERGIALDRTRFHTRASEIVLPGLEDDPLDLVLIDGGHGFPTPVIDWFYTAGRLEVGGLLVMDDTDIWTGAILKSFLCEEPGWRLERDFMGRTAVFEKLQPFEPREWRNQPFVVRKTRRLHLLRQLRQGGNLLRRGRFGELLERIAHERRLKKLRDD